MGGSMVSKRLSLLGFISAAALVSGVLVGCGGSSANTSGVNPVVTTSGGFTTTTGNSTTSVPSSGTPQQVQVTTADGSTSTAVVPAGSDAIDPSSTLAVMPDATPFLDGLAPGKFQRRAQGDVLVSFDGVNYFPTGVNWGAGATLSKKIAFKAPAIGFGIPIFVRLVGPFTINGSAVNRSALTITDSITFGLVVFDDGSTSLPLKLTMKLPANGGYTTGGNFVNLISPKRYKAGAGILEINWPGVQKTQTKVTNNGVLNFYDPFSDPQNDHIPAGGITNVNFLLIKP